MKGLGKAILFLVSFGITTYAALWYFKDTSLVGILMLSILLHEIGHYVVLRSYGVRPSMFFVPLLGAAVSYDQKSAKRFTFGQTARVALAGCVVNALLVVAGAVLFLTGNWGKYAISLASLNALLIIWNLLPFFILDGKKVVQAIFASLNEEEDKTFAGIVTTVAIVAGIVLIFTGKLSFFYFLIFLGINRESDADDPNDAYSPKAMSKVEAGVIGAVYASLLIGSMVLTAYLPSWMT